MQDHNNTERSLFGERTLSAAINLYYELDAPSTGPQPLLISLHGYGANMKQMMREARGMLPHNFALASLQGFHQHLKDPREPGGELRFGFGWLTNFHPEESIALHHRALLDMISTLVHDRVADPDRIFLLGFSQSCALNFRFAFTHTEFLRGVIGICGGLPGDWASSDVYKPTDASVLYLHGTRDEFYPPERVGDFELMLAVRSRMVEVRGYDAGHEITNEMREDVRTWLSERS
jgi:phospholipase/carboxylesterase